MATVPGIPKGLTGLVGLIPSMVRHGQLTAKLVADQRVPIVAKGGLALLVLLILSPLDVPQWIPVLGEVTDAVFILLAFQLFFLLCPKSIVEEHIDELGLRGKIRLLFVG